MSIHHDDTSPQQGETGQPESTSKRAPRNSAQQEALDGALRFKAKLQPSQTHTPDLLDPLTEARLDSSKMLPPGVTYNQRVAALLKSHALGPLYDTMLAGFGLNPPVFSLALLAPPDKSGDISHFKSVLHNIRKDMGVRYPDPIELEARIWGVGQPGQWQTVGYCQELERWGIRVDAHQKQKVQLALVKNAGVRNLQGFLHNVQQKMHAWNPLPVWKEAQVAPVSCFQAANVYVASIKHLLPTEKHDFACKLSAVMWNRRKLVDDAAMLRGNGIQGLQLAETALRNAIANRTAPGASERCSPQDVLKVINPGNKRFAQDLDKIFEKLGLGAEHPHRVFISALVTNARREPDPDMAVSRAIASIADRYSQDDLEKLLCLEYSLLPPAKPLLCPVPENVEYQLEGFLVTIMKSYLEAFQRDFLVRLSLLQYNVQNKTLVDARTSFNSSDLARLAELSVILAGIPRDKLERPISAGSGARFL